MNDRTPTTERLAAAHKEDGSTQAMPDSVLPPVLDACCGSRMFWRDRADKRCLFMDNRTVETELPDNSSPGGSRQLVVRPDVIGDFRNMPFKDESFRVVIFDPPHLVSAGPSSWLRQKYGLLPHSFNDYLRLGFSECFRVLIPFGTLIFKWNTAQIPLYKVLALTPHAPLITHQSNRTFFCVFMK